MLCFFFFNDTATTEIYTLSLHDALPISDRRLLGLRRQRLQPVPQEVIGHLELLGGRQAGELIEPDDARPEVACAVERDRKSTRLNSSHANISYAVFCLKKKKNKHIMLS